MADGGGPTEQDRSEGTPSLSEGPDAGAKRFAYFWASAKVSRRKGETVSGRYRRNGYVHLEENGRLPGRHRRQAGSYILNVHTTGNQPEYTEIEGSPSQTDISAHPVYDATPVSYTHLTLPTSDLV